MSVLCEISRIPLRINLTDAARLDFRVAFPSAGDYTVWLHGYGKNGLSDTVHVGLNDEQPETGQKLRFAPYATWLWSQKRLGTQIPASISVPSPGVHTFQIWMRECGAIVDRIVLTPSATEVISGDGPSESDRY